jgi:hypothetical protein
MLNGNSLCGGVADPEYCDVKALAVISDFSLMQRTAEVYKKS